MYLSAQDLRVEVAAQLDALTHHLTWYFDAYDATTEQTPPLGVGFLPVNNAQHEGEGSVLFTVRPKSGVSGTIANAAAITFDDPPAMNTLAWQNNVDNVAPMSHVAPLPTNQSVTNFTVQWMADASPDVRDFTIYFSENNAPYAEWKTATTMVSDTFHGRNGRSYRFYSRARDVNGNIEAAPASPDAQTGPLTGVEAAAALQFALEGAQPNPALGEIHAWFTLPERAPATLELIDVSGRRVMRHEVGSLGPGRHVLALGGGARLRPGLYFLRLAQGGRFLSSRVALMR